MSTNLFFIARFDGKHARIPRGYEVRFSAPYRGLSVSNLNSLCSNKYRKELAEQAVAQGICEQFKVDYNVIYALATENHFIMECPSLQQEKRDKEQRFEDIRRSSNKKDSNTTPSNNTNAKDSISEPTPRRKNSHTSSDTQKSIRDYGWILMPFVLVFRLFFNSWHCQKSDPSTAYKVWFIFKTILRVCVVAFVAILIIVGCFILYSIFKESH
jgi:hypothetical protein